MIRYLSVQSDVADNLDKLTDHLCNSHISNRVIVDCTASDEMPTRYLEWIKKGIHVVTPNKKLGSGPLDQYRAVRQSQRESYTHWLYEVRTLK